MVVRGGARDDLAGVRRRGGHHRVVVALEIRKYRAGAVIHRHSIRLSGWPRHLKRLPLGLQKQNRKYKCDQHR